VFIRNFEAGNYLETFFMSAVAAVLVIRLFLEITGYPQIGGSRLHIAHMLWGGLLMMASLVILFSFLSRGSNRLAAILGGVGFGTFIDEVGKFVTQDNNYFFKPAVSLIYITFILIFLVIRALHNRAHYAQKEYLMNALQELEEVVLHDLDRNEMRRALRLLDKSASNDPLVTSLKDLLYRTDLVPVSRPGAWKRLKTYFENRYQKITQWRWFHRALILFFLIQFLIKLFYAIVLIFFIGFGWDRGLHIRYFHDIAQRMQTLSFGSGAQLASSLLSGVFVFWGIIQIRKSRVTAFRMFERSILISIFLTQIFIFYHEQFTALLGLSFNLLILLALKQMIGLEERALKEKQ
jgi:hypothetical protein